MTDSSPLLAGKTALVTGSAVGIGAAIAEALESAGATVIRHVLPGQQEPGTENHIACDFRDREAVQRFIGEVLTASHSSLDILVNNAGIELPSPFPDVEMDDARAQFEVNFFAPLALMTGLSGALSTNGGGAIVNVTSIHASMPSPQNSVYSASKAALDMLSRTAAVELARQGVRVNCLAPGAIETDMNRHLIEEVGRDYFDGAIPLGYVGTPAALSEAVLFLCSHRSDYMTGGALVIDGGYTQNLVRYGGTH